MKKHLLFLGLLCPIFFFFFGVGETADTTISRQYNVEEVTVVGFKQDAPIKEALSITSISAANIRQAEMTSIKDLGYVVPNFFIPEYGTRQNSPVFVRGVGAKTNGPTVGFYIDGVPHMERSAFDDDLFDVSSLEVLRGPQGTLYGRNCIGGIINAYTRSPFDYQGTRVKVGYGSYNDIVVNASHYNKLNEKLAFAVNGSYHHNDGFFRNAYDDSKVDKFNEGFLRGRVFWKPAEHWTLIADLSYRNSDQGGYPYATYNPETRKTGDINYNRYSSYLRQLTTAGFNARYEGQKFSFNSQTAYQYIDDNQGIDQDFMPNDLNWVNQRVRQNIFSEELTLKSKTSGCYQWMVGAFFFSDSYKKSTYIHYIPQNYCMPNLYDSPTMGLSVYHQSSLRIIGGLSAKLGLRFDYEHAKENYEAYLFETEPRLHDAGYRVVMAKPDYAEVEAEFESLRQKTRETFLTSGLALSVGLLIAGGSLALFWRGDYLTERRLGAKKREAMGLYCRAFGLVSFSSLLLSSLFLFLLGKTGLVPFLAPENLSFASFGIMALFALAELFLFALVALSVILFTDRRKLGGQ